MSELETKAIDLLNKMEALTENYAPEILNKSVEIMQLSSIATLVETVVVLLCGIALMFGAKFWYVYATKKYDDSDSYSEWDTSAVVGGLVGGVLGGVLALSAFICMFDFWMWAGIFNPETALAYKVLGL